MNEEALAHWGLSRQKQIKKHCVYPYSALVINCIFIIIIIIILHGLDRLICFRYRCVAIVSWGARDPFFPGVCR